MRKMLKHTVETLIILIVMMLANSCAQGTQINFSDISSSGWGYNQVLTFNNLKNNSSSPSEYELLVDIIHNNRYRYSDIYISVVVNNAVGDTLYVDTVKSTLADKYGKWRGEGWGGVFTKKIIMPQTIRLMPDSTCTVQVHHAMCDSILVGVEKVGVELQPINR